MDRERAPPREYTPALGANWLTPFYDFAIAAFTREGVWRRGVLELVDPRLEDRILDVGCGTGSLVAPLALTADVIGVDPDAKVLARAAQKAAASGGRARFIQGFLSAEILPPEWSPTKIVSSLVLHQTPLAEKRRIVGQIRDLLPVGGVFVLADYGRQPTVSQRFLFRQMVQRVDGATNTQPNVEGVLETLLAQAGFDGASPVRTIKTLTGAISLWRAVRRC